MLRSADRLCDPQQSGRRTTAASAAAGEPLGRNPSAVRRLSTSLLCLIFLLFHPLAVTTSATLSRSRLNAARARRLLQVSGYEDPASLSLPSATVAGKNASLHFFKLLYSSQQYGDTIRLAGDIVLDPADADRAAAALGKVPYTASVEADLTITGDNPSNISRLDFRRLTSDVLWLYWGVTLTFKDLELYTTPTDPSRDQTLSLGFIRGAGGSVLIENCVHRWADCLSTESADGQQLSELDFVFQGAYCWTNWTGGQVCVPKALYLPTFSTYVDQPSEGGYSLQYQNSHVVCGLAEDVQQPEGVQGKQPDANNQTKQSPEGIQDKKHPETDQREHTEGNQGKEFKQPEGIQTKELVACILHGGATGCFDGQFLQVKSLVERLPFAARIALAGVCGLFVVIVFLALIVCRPRPNIVALVLISTLDSLLDVAYILLMPFYNLVLRWVLVACFLGQLVVFVLCNVIINTFRNLGAQRTSRMCSVVARTGRRVCKCLWWVGSDMEARSLFALAIWIFLRSLWLFCLVIFSAGVVVAAGLGVLLSLVTLLFGCVLVLTKLIAIDSIRSFWWRCWQSSPTTATATTIGTTVIPAPDIDTSRQPAAVAAAPATTIIIRDTPTRDSLGRHNATWARRLILVELLLETYPSLGAQIANNMRGGAWTPVAIASAAVSCFLAVDAGYQVLYWTLWRHKRLKDVPLDNGILAKVFTFVHDVVLVRICCCCCKRDDDGSSKGGALGEDGRGRDEHALVADIPADSKDVEALDGVVQVRREMNTAVDDLVLVGEDGAATSEVQAQLESGKAGVRVNSPAGERDAPAAAAEVRAPVENGARQERSGVEAKGDIEVAETEGSMEEERNVHEDGPAGDERDLRAEILTARGQQGNTAGATGVVGNRVAARRATGMGAVPRPLPRSSSL